MLRARLAAKLNEIRLQHYPDDQDWKVEVPTDLSLDAHMNASHEVVRVLVTLPLGGVEVQTYEVLLGAKYGDFVKYVDVVLVPVAPFPTTR